MNHVLNEPPYYSVLHMNNDLVSFFIAGTQTTPPPMPPSLAPSNNVTSSIPLPPAYACTTSQTKTVTGKTRQPSQISQSSRNGATTQGNIHHCVKYYYQSDERSTQHLC